MRRYHLIIGSWVAAWIVLAGCSKKQESSQRPSPAPPTPATPATAPATAPEAVTTGTKPGTATTRPGLISTVPAAESTLTSIESLSVSLQPREKAALAVLFWNTRDADMDAQAKAAVVLYKRFHAKGLDVISICTDASEDRVTDFAERWQLPWPQVMNATAPDPKPMERFKVEKTPACLLFVYGDAGPLALKLDATDEAHAAVAKVLDVKLDELQMPSEPSRYSPERRSGMDSMMVLQMLMGGQAEEKDIAEQVVSVFEEDDSRTRVDEVVDALCGGPVKRKLPAIMEAAMPQLSAEAQVRVVRAVMVRVPDGLECLFPTLKKFPLDNPALEAVTRWDRSQFGRALVLAGEFNGAANVLRKVAEEKEEETAWWYMVGWAELCAGRAEAARETLLRSYVADGKYNGAAAKIAGDMAAFFLGKMDHEAFLKSQDAKIGQFFIGERYLLSGEKDKAVEAYNACIKAGKKSTDPWPCNWAQVRLKQLEGKVQGLPKALEPSARPWGQDTGTRPASAPMT